MARRVSKARQVLQEHADRQGLLDHEVSVEIPEPSAPQDERESKERQENKVRPGRVERRVRRGRQALAVPQADRPGRRVLSAPPGL